jgi:hypothetical protein
MSNEGGSVAMAQVVYAGVDRPVQSLTIHPQNPVAFVNRPLQLAVTFKSQPARNDFLYQWDFGDGIITYTVQPAVTHIYTQKRNVVVTVTTIISPADPINPGVPPPYGDTVVLVSSDMFLAPVSLNAQFPDELNLSLSLDRIRPSPPHRLPCRAPPW